MTAAWGILLTIVAIAVAGTLLALLWVQAERRFKGRALDRPREDQDLQMHQAVSRSQVSP